MGNPMNIDKFKTAKYLLNIGKTPKEIAKMLDVKETTVELIPESEDPVELDRKIMEKMRENNRNFTKKQKGPDIPGDGGKETVLYIAEGLWLISGFFNGLYETQKEMVKLLKEIKEKEIKAQFTPPIKLMDNSDKQTEHIRIINNKLGEIMDKVSALEAAWNNK